MLPIGDDNSNRKSLPYINYILIALNVFVFIFLQQFGKNEDFLLSYSMVPDEILTGKDFITSDGRGVSPYPVHITIISAMFMHGSIGHLIGNMLYLWVFGDNLEDKIGHRKYLFYYLLCGLIASISHVAFTAILGRDMFVPSLGASGAISGVLGGYLMLFPKNRISVLLLVFVIRIPAFVALGLWIVWQLYNGYNDVGLAEGTDAGGVAYAAHVGGFIAGLILIRLFLKRNPPEIMSASNL